jgi:predicted amidohydrolase YtcJ
MILENGVIRTGDPALPSVRALAVAGDRVAGGVDVREGDRSTVSPERVDLDGRCVVPGFCDAHVHFLEWSLAGRRIDLSDAATPSEAFSLVAAAARGETPGAWVVGRGLREAEWRDRPFDREALDAAAGGRPCVLLAHDHHTLWASSAALAAVPSNGLPVVERGADGRPSGVLREDAAFALAQAVPKPTGADADEVVRAGIRQAHTVGVTAVHDFQQRGGLGAWQRLHADRRLDLRVWKSLPAATLDDVLELELAGGFGDDWLRLGPVKAFADGTLGSRTASLLAPDDLGGQGLELLGRDELAELVHRAAGGGLDVAVHAIGDRANRTVLDALEDTREAWQPRGLRPRIEHAQLVDPADTGRFASLGVTASVQPSHYSSDRPTALEVWGAERLQHAYAYADLAGAGAVLCAGSDAPIEPLDPLAGVQAALQRDPSDGPALSAEQACEAFWGGAAFAVHAERRLGRLLPGYLADLCVLDRDPMTCPADEIGEIEVVATMVGGRWVHGGPPW